MEWLDKIKRSGNNQIDIDNKFKSLMLQVEKIIPFLEKYKNEFMESGLKVYSHANKDVSPRWINIDQEYYRLSIGSADISGNIRIIIREKIIVVACSAHYSMDEYLYNDNDPIQEEHAVFWLKYITRQPTLIDKYKRLVE